MLNFNAKLLHHVKCLSSIIHLRPGQGTQLQINPRLATTARHFAIPDGQTNAEKLSKSKQATLSTTYLI